MFSFKDISTSKNIEHIIYDLHRKIDSIYFDLPWPSQIKNIVIYTEIVGGYGDVAAAGKIIQMLQKISLEIKIHWLIRGRIKEDPERFISRSSPIIKINDYKIEVPIDLIICGPTNITYRGKQWERILNQPIKCPIINFLENGHSEANTTYVVLDKLAKIPKLYKYNLKENKHEVVKPTLKDIEEHQKEREKFIPNLIQDWSNILIPSPSCLSMGLKLGTGVLLDENLSQMNFTIKDLNEAVNNYLNLTNSVNFENWSINFGYAHKIVSKKKFIDCILFQDNYKRKNSGSSFNQKDILIILNQNGELEKYTTSEFRDKIFTTKRLKYLSKKGFKQIIFQGENQDNDKPTAEYIKNRNSNGRKLILLVRPWFQVEDCRIFQYFSERILATGDNTAIEAWIMGCKLYLYEDVANCGCKWKFLQQQVDLAFTISSDLSLLLAMFGGDQRTYKQNLNSEWSNEDLPIIKKLVRDPNLVENTLKFCSKIISKYSFENPFIGFVKRAAWHSVNPNLSQIETKSANNKFLQEFISMMEDENIKWNKSIEIHPDFKTKIRENINTALI